MDQQTSTSRAKPPVILWVMGCAWVLLIAALVGGLWLKWRQTDRAAQHLRAQRTAELLLISQAIASYREENDGILPGSFDDLSSDRLGDRKILDGFCYVGQRGGVLAYHKQPVRARAEDFEATEPRRGPRLSRLVLLDRRGPPVYMDESSLQAMLMGPSLLEALADLQPSDAAGYRSRGYARKAKGDLDGAIADWLKVIELDPKDAGVHNSLAWLYATAADAKYHDAKRAIEMAEKAVALDGRKEPQYVDTLAAALARAGRFEEAVKVQEAAIRMLPARAKERAEFEPRLKLYRDGRPYAQKPAVKRGAP